MARRPRSNLTARFLGVISAMFITIFCGSIGYWLLTDADHAMLDCVYMSVITVTTVGFGEVIDIKENPAARVLTMILALAGIDYHEAPGGV